MNGDVDIAGLAGVLSDSTRCRVLLSLGDGRALPASVLAAEAGVAPSTASEHLSKLLDARLLDVTRLRRGRRRLIRNCLDWSEQRHHLAGALGAAMAQRLLELRWLEPAPTGRAVFLTDAGRTGLTAAFGLDVAE